MITLNEYLYRPIITQELVDIFEEFINSTYNDDSVLSKNIIGDAEKDTKNDIEADNILYIGIEISNCQTLYKAIADSKSDKNKDEIETILSNLEKKYNEILSEVTFKDKKIPDECKITNNINNDLDALDKIENNSKMGGIIGDLRSLSEQIKNTITKLKEQSSDNKEELNDEVKTNDNTKEISDKVKKLQNSFNDKLKEVNDFINQLKNTTIKERISGTLDSIKNVYEYYNDIQVNTIKHYLNNKQYDKANEYVTDALEVVTNRQIKRLDELITTIKTELEFANNNESDNDAESPEVQQTAETESDIIKTDLIKKVASEVNVNVESLEKYYGKITKFLSKSNDLTKEMVASIANTNDDDAIIGLNLMLLGAITTTNLPNSSKIISQYCSVIQKSVENNKYYKIFDKSTKKESK